MMCKYRITSKLFAAAIMFAATQSLDGLVSDITGDTGSAQSGSLTLSGGTSGGIFDSTTSIITQSFTFLVLPNTSATDGQLIIGGETVLHTYAPGNQNLFVGSSAGNFTETASFNTGLGSVALNVVSTGSSNTALGRLEMHLKK